MTEYPIPDIPGQLVQDPGMVHILREKVATMCRLQSLKFPGSQPISFSNASLDLLERRDFWVCEKSDGIRVLVLVLFNTEAGKQDVFMLDRKERFFLTEGVRFPHWEDINRPLDETLFDGELVIDIEKSTGQQTLRLYAFDALVVGGENIMQKPLLKRYGRLKSWIVDPHQKGIRKFPDWQVGMPFEIVAKKQELSYAIETVVNDQIPALKHGHDGLIFTCAESSYVAGTDENILKWKPPSENSIDFRVELRFPPSAENSDEPDYYAKPEILLNTWTGGNSRQNHEYFDQLDMTDEEWEKFKEKGEQLDDRVIEVCWDTQRSGWRFMRFRDDKLNANHKSIMRKIIDSISDGVELEALMTRAPRIRAAWKARAAAAGPPTPATAPPQQGSSYGSQGYAKSSNGSVAAGLRR